MWVPFQEVPTISAWNIVVLCHPMFLICLQYHVPPKEPQNDRRHYRLRLVSIPPLLEKLEVSSVTFKPLEAVVDIIFTRE